MSQAIDQHERQLPLVSIIVPVFNGETYLRQSLDSILAQTYPRIEILVMDDASTDGTPDIIRSYGDRIIHCRQLENRGIYGNMNDGIAIARGEYIASYHADDVYLPTIVEREVWFLENNPEAGAVFCKDIFIGPSGQELGRLELPPTIEGGRPLPYPVILNGLLTYKNRFLRCPSSMVRASVIRKIGGYRDEIFRNTSDLDMWLRIARHSPVGILDEYLFCYRRGHGRSSERYHRLRTDPERFFLIMDMYLSEGDHTIAAPEALRAYEAHRAQDRIMCAVSHYILGQNQEAREILNGVQVHRILGSSQIQRGRMLILFLILQTLTRLPRIQLVADFFQRRWHTKRIPA